MDTRILVKLVLPDKSFVNGYKNLGEVGLPDKIFVRKPGTCILAFSQEEKLKQVFRYYQFKWK